MKFNKEEKFFGDGLAAEYKMRSYWRETLEATYNATFNFIKSEKWEGLPLMKRKIILILLTIGLLYYWFGYIEYKPVSVNKKNHRFYIKDKEDLIDEFNENLIYILEMFDHQYKEKNGKVYIRPLLAFDKDLCSNYTRKANSKIWVERQKKLKIYKSSDDDQ